MREPRNHVFIIDGTLSRVDSDACLTHAARLHTLLKAGQDHKKQTVGYDRGIQGVGLSKWIDAAIGRGFNDSVIRGYATLASRYEPGDRIFLFGYSRGAYAVRSIAGMIERIGLLRREVATERRIKLAFRYYQRGFDTPPTRAFRRSRCHAEVDIAHIGAWDTVKALGLPYPLLSRIFPMATEFHDHHLGTSVRAACHALAADEDRTAYSPVLWQCSNWRGRLEQMWFPGAHGDIGGERDCRTDAIPLTNISFTWVIEHAIRHGLMMPEGWRDAFPTDPTAPMVGSRAGMNRLFLLRRPREVTIGDSGQEVHPAVYERQLGVANYRPRALGIPPPDPAPDLAPEQQTAPSLPHTA